MFDRFYKRLQAMAAGDRVREKEPMSRHTSFKIGGPADIWFSPADAREVQSCILWAKEDGVPLMTLGNGSNLLVSDEGIQGAVMQIGEDMAAIEVDGRHITAQAGAKLVSVCRAAAKASLTGLEFAYGIPGCVGGAVTMDAGAYGGDIGSVIAWVDVMDRDGNRRRICREDMHFAYRHSLVMEEELIVLGACFELEKGDGEAIRARMEELNERRRDKQPLNYPSAGSVFKRPEGYFAGQLIEEAGLKGARVGDAQVSEKHAGFIVNLGQATAKDVTDLIRHVQQVVYERSGVMLEPEVRIIGRT